MDKKIVYAIENNTVITEINGKTDITKLKSIGGKKSFLNSQKWKFNYSNKKELANILNFLRNEDFYFLNTPYGWPPYAVFQQLKDEELLDGTCKEIMYNGKEYK